MEASLTCNNYNCSGDQSINTIKEQGASTQTSAYAT